MNKRSEWTLHSHAYTCDVCMYVPTCVHVLYKHFK